MAKKKAKKKTQRKKRKPYVALGPARKATFLAALRETGIVRRAAELAGVNHDTAYQERKRDERFAAAWDAAKDAAIEDMELEARRRGVHGVTEPVIKEGEVVWHYVDAESGLPCEPHHPNAQRAPLTIRKYSDNLLMFLLKGARPEQYREQHHIKHSGQVDHVHSGSVATDAWLEEELGDDLEEERKPH